MHCHNCVDEWAIVEMLDLNVYQEERNRTKSRACTAVAKCKEIQDNIWTSQEQEINGPQIGLAKDVQKLRLNETDTDGTAEFEMRSASCMLYTNTLLHSPSGAYWTTATVLQRRLTGTKKQVHGQDGYHISIADVSSISRDRESSCLKHGATSS